MQIEIKIIDSAIAEVAKVSPSISQNLRQYTEYYETIKEKVNNAEDTIQKEVNLSILNKVIELLQPIREKCHTVSQWTHIATFAMLIIFALTSLLFTLGLYRNCFKYIVCIWGYLMWLLIFSLGTFAFVSLILGSDFCSTSKKVLEKYISTPITDYYLYCDKHTKPLNCSDSVVQYMTNDQNGNIASLVLNAPLVPTLPPLPTMPTFSTKGEID